MSGHTVSDAVLQKPRLTRVWADTVNTGRCASARCGVRITFARFVKSNFAHPFDGELVALKTERDPESGREIWHVDLSTSHFGTCVDAKRFSRR